jgi:Na+/proline symporter
MVAMTVIGLLVSLAAVYVPNFGLQQLWWVFHTIAACVMIPTVLSLYWDRLDERGVFWGVLVAFFVGIPLFVYSNLIDNPVWIVGSTFFVVGITLLFCLALPKRSAH